MSQEKKHPLIYTYLKKYQDNPESKVFAPLAEAYRKAGLLDEALDVVREGLRIHPRFVGGRVAHARILFDKMLYKDVISELLPIVEDIPDNIIAQRLLAESSLVVGDTVGALRAYKMLLYFLPQDVELSRIVQELEAQSYEKGSVLVKPEELPQFDVRPAEKAIEEDPAQKRRLMIEKVEKLQKLLQRVERYRSRISQSSSLMHH